MANNSAFLASSVNSVEVVHRSRIHLFISVFRHFQQPNMLPFALFNNTFACDNSPRAILPHAALYADSKTSRSCRDAFLALVK